MATNGQLPKLFTDLEALRRANDWTYQELSEAIAKVTQLSRDDDCWRRICQGLTTKPQGRTVGIIETFLASVRPKAAAKRRVRRAA
jgi:hypothetical protein